MKIYLYMNRKKENIAVFFVDYVIMGDFKNEHSLRTIEY